MKGFLKKDIYKIVQNKSNPRGKTICPFLKIQALTRNKILIYHLYYLFLQDIPQQQNIFDSNEIVNIRSTQNHSNFKVGR